MSDEILVVEDDDNIRQLLRISLRTEGYRVCEAPSGTVALSLYEANAPALVLLDLGLPDIDGMEVLARIRADGATPVIVVTARNQDEQKVRALDAGADDYVVKPFSMAELFARIRVALRHRALRDGADAVGAVRVSQSTDSSSIAIRAPSRSTARRSTSRLTSTICCSS